MNAVLRAFSIPDFLTKFKIFDDYRTEFVLDPLVVSIEQKVIISLFYSCFHRRNFKFFLNKKIGSNIFVVFSIASVAFKVTLLSK